MASALSNSHICVHIGVVEGCGTGLLHQYPHPLLVKFREGAGHGVKVIVENGGMFVKHHFHPETYPVYCCASVHVQVGVVVRRGRRNARPCWK